MEGIQSKHLFNTPLRVIGCIPEPNVGFLVGVTRIALASLYCTQQLLKSLLQRSLQPLEETKWGFFAMVQGVLELIPYVAVAINLFAFIYNWRSGRREEVAENLDAGNELTPEMLREAFNRGEVPDEVFEGGMNVLHMAVLGNRIDLIDVCLDCQPELLNSTTEPGETPLHFAVKGTEQRASLDRLLRSVTEINPRDKFGFIPLHVAAMENNHYAVQQLVDRGANVDAKGKPHGFTPLAYAVMKNHLEVARILVEGGASTRFFCNTGQIDLIQDALLSNASEMAQILQGGGARAAV